MFWNDVRHLGIEISYCTSPLWSFKYGIPKIRSNLFIEFLRLLHTFTLQSDDVVFMIKFLSQTYEGCLEGDIYTWEENSSRFLIAAQKSKALVAGLN